MHRNILRDTIFKIERTPVSRRNSGYGPRIIRPGPFILLEAWRYLLVIFLKRRKCDATRLGRGRPLFFLVSSSGSYRIR